MSFQRAFIDRSNVQDSAREEAVQKSIPTPIPRFFAGQFFGGRIGVMFLRCLGLNHVTLEEQSNMG